ncbi:hypothetical protein ACFVU0_10235 [Streptomyces sp. NPDC058122]|uniref:hypothetical protein n=1 Tax=Streptomyces sp. NPDC058122 TaxID=3346349 RepID=UPI0036E66BE5
MSLPAWYPAVHGLLLAAAMTGFGPAPARPRWQGWILAAALLCAAARKGYFGKRPRTWLALTLTGREALAGHLAALEAPAAAARRAGAETAEAGGAGGEPA